MSRITVMRYPVLRVLRVVDGDTFDLHLDLGLRQYGHYRIRLLLVDTPEIYGANASPEGQEAKEFTERWFEEAADVWLEVHKEGSFSRWIGEPLDIGNEAASLSGALLKAGLAEEYTR